MFSTTLTSGGRLTVPREVRKRLSWRPGDRIQFAFDSAGVLFLDRVETGAVIRQRNREGRRRQARRF